MTKANSLLTNAKDLAVSRIASQIENLQFTPVAMTDGAATEPQGDAESKAAAVEAKPVSPARTALMDTVSAAEMLKEKKGVFTWSKHSSSEKGYNGGKAYGRAKALLKKRDWSGADNDSVARLLVEAQKGLAHYGLALRFGKDGAATLSQAAKAAPSKPAMSTQKAEKPKGKPEPVAEPEAKEEPSSDLDEDIIDAAEKALINGNLTPAKKRLIMAILNS